MAGEVLADLQARATFAWFWVAAWRHGLRRSSEWWISVSMLLLTLIVTAFTGYATLRTAPSAAALDFRTGVEQGSGSLQSFATAKPGATLPVRLQLTPHNQDLGGVSLAITPPPHAELVHCVWRVGNDDPDECAMPDGEARVDLEQLNSGETLRLSVRVEVLTSVDDHESIEFEMNSAEAGASTREVDLFSP
jgi:hypothetical protein